MLCVFHRWDLDGCVCEAYVLRDGRKEEDTLSVRPLGNACIKIKGEKEREQVVTVLLTRFVKTHLLFLSNIVVQEKSCFQAS